MAQGNCPADPTEGRIMIRPDIQNEIDLANAAFAGIRTELAKIERKLVRMMTENDVVRLIRAFADVKGWKVSHAARVASGNGDTVDRLEAGVGLTIRRANAIIYRVSVLWPEDCEWPTGTPRPDPEAGDAA
jgi:hypothetical protein